MQRANLFPAALTATILLTALGGCSPDQPDQPPPAKEPPAEDRTLALRQRTCPVSGELLGSMGAPYKATVEGQTVFLCCQGCEPQLLEEPQKYLAKLAD
jgi:YHS domain-containing protein